MTTLRTLEEIAARLNASITRLQLRIGAEIGQVDLRPPLSDDLRDFLRAALVKYRVIFFRDQDMTREQHVALGREFGELEIHPMSQGAYPELLPLRTKPSEPIYRASVWHTDVTFRPNPPMGAILRIIQAPEIGGDTVWACAVSAYEGLDDETKAQIQNLNATHDALVSFGANLSAEDREKIARDHPPVVHPIVRIHPDTGEKMLFVNANFTTGIVGLEPDEGNALLTRLFAQFYRPEYQVRFKWRPGSIAFWDERSTQHYAVPGFEGSEDRIVERVTIVGDVPYGPANATGSNVRMNA